MIPIATLLSRYRTGYFPMAVEGRIGWFSPERRGVIPLDRFQVPRRLARVLRQGRFQSTVNRSFRDVITACASREDIRGNWIDEDILESYCALHDAGHAHSVEVWDEQQLVGGLYGVNLCGAFFGESMFHRVRDASKVALCVLVERLFKLPVEDVVNTSISFIVVECYNVSVHNLLSISSGVRITTNVNSFAWELFQVLPNVTSKVGNYFTSKFFKFSFHLF